MMHGILSNKEAMAGLAGFITAAHPGTTVHNIDAYNDLVSSSASQSDSPQTFRVCIWPRNYCYVTAYVLHVQWECMIHTVGKSCYPGFYLGFCPWGGSSKRGLPLGLKARMSHKCTTSPSLFGGGSLGGGSFPPLPVDRTLLSN